RIHDQSADRSLLHAGLEYDGSARTRRALRRLRHARTWTPVVLFAGDETGTQVERTSDLVCVLGHQYRPDVGNPFKLAPSWFDANLSIGLRRLLVGAEFLIYADRLDADSALVADDRRQHIRARRSLVCLLRIQFDVATPGQKSRCRFHQYSGRGRLRELCNIPKRYLGPAKGSRRKRCRATGCLLDSANGSCVPAAWN